MKYEAYRPPMLRLTMFANATDDPRLMNDRSTEMAAVITMVLTGIRVRGWSFGR